MLGCHSSVRRPEHEPPPHPTAVSNARSSRHLCVLPPKQLDRKAQHYGENLKLANESDMQEGAGQLTLASLVWLALWAKAGSKGVNVVHSTTVCKSLAPSNAGLHAPRRLKKIMVQHGVDQ